MNDLFIRLGKWTAPGAFVRSAVMAMTLASLVSGLTGCLPNREPTAPVSIDRPNPMVMTPAAGTLIVPRTATVRMAFSAPMNLGSFAGHFFLHDISGNEIPGGFSGADTTVIFLPLQPLASATVYHAELRGRVRNIHNMSIQLNNQPVFDDTTLLMSTWFYTEGSYSSGGYFPVYVRDRKEGKIRVFSRLDSSITSVVGMGAPEGMALSPDGTRLYVTGTTQDSIFIVNTQSSSVEKALSVAQYPSAVTAYGSTAAVISINGQKLTKIDLGSETITLQKALTFYPARIAVSTDGGTLFTLDQVTRDLVLLKESDGSTIKRLAGAFTQLVIGDLVVDKSSGLLYVCDAKGLKIKSTDASGSAFQTVMTFRTGVEPVSMAFSPTTAGEYYVAAGNFIFKCNLSNPVPADTISLAAAAKGVTVVPSGDVVYATYGSDLIIVDAKSFAVLRDIPTTSSGLEGVLAGPNR